jgi:hypothetical protein
VRPTPHGFQRRILLTAAAAWAVGSQAQAAAGLPPEVAADVPGAKLIGEGRLRFLGLRIYDARLWSAQPPASDWSAAPLALELRYARSLDGAKIADRSLDEMRRQGDIEPAVAQRWLAAMTQLFPDVKENDRITGVLLPGLGARFFFNGQARGDLRDVRFARLFFGIWLSPKTSEPALRESLLGGAPR